MIIGFHTFFPSACFAAATPAFIASMGRMAFRLLSATFHSSANMVDVELLTPVTVGHPTNRNFETVSFSEEWEGVAGVARIGEIQRAEGSVA